MIFQLNNSAVLKVSFLLIVGVVFGCFDGRAQKAKAKDPVTVNILPYNKKARFNKKFPVKYKIQFINNLKDAQEGSLVYTVFDNTNQEVLVNSLDVRVNAKKTLVSNFEVPIVKEGNYTIKMTIELTNFNSTYDGSFAYIGPPRKFFWPFFAIFSLTCVALTVSPNSVSTIAVNVPSCLTLYLFAIDTEYLIFSPS